MEDTMYFKNISKLTLFALLCLSTVQPAANAALVAGQTSAITSDSTFEWALKKLSFNIPVNFHSMYKGVSDHPWITISVLGGLTYGFMKLTGILHRKVVAAKTLITQLNKFHDHKTIYTRTQEDIPSLKKDATDNAFKLGGIKLKEQVEYYFENWTATSTEPLIHVIISHLVPFRSYLLTIPRLSPEA
jgi:hypothetical protein